MLGIEWTGATIPQRQEASLVGIVSVVVECRVGAVLAAATV
jgi:hypothetical protein